MTNEQLRELYLRDLAKMVTYGNTPPTPRVKRISMWENLQPPTVCLEPECLHASNRNVWVWSDQHLGHKNIIRYSDRPFSSVGEMVEQLIANYNLCVKDNDICLWVGDVAFMGDEGANALLDQCNGYKILIVGNHDFNHGKLKKMNFDEVHLLYTIEYPDIGLLFTHYPLEEGLPEGYVNVHGHIHRGRHELKSSRHINVNCEFHEYKPARLTDIVQWARTRLNSL
jgi:calcineurin-like phosphoesterase family protein